MRITIAKPNVFNSYGILMPQGTIQTVDNAFGASLVSALQAIDTDGALSIPTNKPFASVPTPLSGVYVYAGLPSASLMGAGTTAMTSDRGPVVSSGTTWTPVIGGTVANRAIVVGDSLLANAFAPTGVNTAVGGFVVSKGVATINTSSAGNHNVMPGNYCQIYNSSDVTFSADINGANIVPLSVPSNTGLTFPTSLADGDYSAAYGGQWFVAPLSFTQDVSYFVWLNYFAKNPFLIVASYAIGGVPSTILALLQSKILAGPKFSTVIIQVGTNDIQTAASAAQATASAVTALANITAFAKTMVAAGYNVIIGTPPPVAAAHANPLICNVGFNQLRYGLLQLAQSTTSVKVLDIFADMILGTSATGDAVAGYLVSTDNVHPSTTACIASIVRNESFASIGRDIQPVTIIDDSQTYTSTGAPSPNIVPHPLFDGTTGTVSAPATGTAPASWTIGGVTGSAASVGGAARSAVAGSNAANWGNAWTVNASWTVGGGYTLSSAQVNTSIIPNTWYRYGITVKALANAVNLNRLYIQWYQNGTVGGLNVLNGSLANYDSASILNNGYPLLTGDVLELQSGPVFVPPGSTFSSSIIQVIVAGTGVGSANLEFASCFLRPIANPYS